MAEAAQRVEEIVDAAEAVAESIRREAEHEADRYLEERGREADRLVADHANALIELKAALSARAERARDDLNSMAAELERALGSIRSPVETGGSTAAKEDDDRDPGKDEGSGGDRQASAAARPLRPVAYAGANGEAEPPAPGQAEPPPAGAFLRATQLAIAGRQRDEIEATLREELGVSDPASVIDAILEKR